MVIEPQVTWMAPSPIWSKLGQNAQSVQLRRPMLLRFASDSFIEDLQAQLAADPTRLDDLAARPESFQARPSGQPRNWTPPAPSTLKLYQPAHGHFYLVTCSLVCQIAGMPDRTVDAARQERASFVIRRLRPNPAQPGAWIEYAWATGTPTTEQTALPARTQTPRQVMAQKAVLAQRTLTAQSVGLTTDLPQQPGWVELAPQQERSVLAGEERLPLFPMPFVQDGRARRLLAGYIPVANRETFQAAPELSPIGDYDPTLELGERVIDPLKSLDEITTIPPAEARTVSRFILLDLADFLMLHLPNLHARVVGSGTPGLTNPEQTVLNNLNNWTVGGSTSWRAALAAVWAQKDTINETGTAPGTNFNLRASNPSLATIISQLESSLGAALAGGNFQSPEPAPAIPKLATADGDRYVIRAVYERPTCRRTPVAVSNRSQIFQFAPFFDFDAPARPVTITMPDTSLPNLRKFGRNVTIVMSQKLSEQIQQATGVKIKDLENGDLGSSSGALGMICTFSIPIITICALILLMIIVQLLNIVFWWLPLFKICIPVKQ
jgi:hypothetical protein